MAARNFSLVKLWWFLSRSFTTAHHQRGIVVRTLVKLNASTRVRFAQCAVVLAYPTGLGYEGAKKSKSTRNCCADSIDARGGAGQHGQAPTDAGRL